MLFQADPIESQVHDGAPTKLLFKFLVELGGEKGALTVTSVMEHRGIQCGKDLASPGLYPTLAHSGTLADLGHQLAATRLGQVLTMLKGRGHPVAETAVGRDECGCTIACLGELRAQLGEQT